MKRMNNKLHVYTGNGKGKTTAAMGLAVRSAGHGRRVLIAQFLKDGRSGELNAFKMLPSVEVYPMKPVSGFVFVEEHIPCHKGAYTGKSGITRDRTGKLWYYRNLKR